VAPLRRHDGPRAEEAYLRARLLELQIAGDIAGEREVATALARLLSSRGTDLDTATALARRALALGDDPALRAEVAGWLAGLGEPGLGAGMLRGLVGPGRTTEMAPTLVRIAVLLARGGDPAAAADTLREAAALDTREAIASELLGTLAAWAPAEVSPAASAGAYLEAAVRREAHGEKEAAFEDRLRAFEIAPGESLPAAALATALAGRGRTAAADEVLRAHAAAVWANDAARAREIHKGRMLAALEDADAPRALGAAVDAELEAELEGDIGLKVDEVLAAAGLYELFAFRLERKAEGRKGAARADTYQALARLYAGPLASSDRAAEAWIEALANRAENAMARAALREHASGLGDRTPLVEALVRAALADPGAAPGGPRSQALAVRQARLEALRELAALAEDELDDAALATFAHEKLAAAGAGDAHAAAVERLAPKKAAQDQALADARARLVAATGDARAPHLAAVAKLLASRPDEPDAYLAVLAELAAREPQDRAVGLAFERVSFRTSRFDRLEATLRARVAASPDRVELVRARLTLSAIARRRGDAAAALEEVLPLLTEAAGHRGAASAVLVLATQLGRVRERAEALAQLARPVSPQLRAVLLAVAAELHGRVGEYEGARKLAEQASEADSTCARAVATLALLVGAQRDRVAAAAVERAMGVIVPRGALCDGLAEALEELGEMPLALAWTQRWLALRPGCPRALKKLLRRAVSARDASRLGDAIAWMLSQPEPMGSLGRDYADALQTLFALDPARALGFARRSLDVFGPRLTVLRHTLLELAHRGADAGLAIAVLERWIAAESSAAKTAEPLLDLARRRADAGDLSGAARELCRAAERLPLPGEAPDPLVGAPPDAAVLLETVEAIEQRAKTAGTALGSDGLVALGESRARALASLGPDRAAEAAEAFRELGTLRWDLAQDRLGAEEAFFFASELVVEGGAELYARDLAAIAGVHEAIAAIARRAAPEVGAPPMTVADALVRFDPARKRRARLLVEAARLASEHGLPDRALTAAAAAIEADPTRADAIALVEKSAHVEGGLEVLDRAYRHLAEAALGCYGRRAAHYRAARQFEQRQSLDLAMRHAAACFEAVPAEGTSYELLARLAERAGDAIEIVRVIERVAAASEPGARTLWLKRAAGLAGKSPDGLRTRIDILLRALLLRPDAEMVVEVGAASKQLRDAGADLDIERMRFARAARTILPKLDGPEGSRAAIALARVAIEVFAEGELALEATARGLDVDGDLDEFASLGAEVAALAKVEGAAGFVARVAAAASKPYASVGAPLLRVTSELAAALGDAAGAAALLVQAARRAPDDDDLVARAADAVARLADPALAKAFDDTVPASTRVSATIRVADALSRKGEDDAAVALLQRALAADGLREQDRVGLLGRLRATLEVAGRAVELEPVLRKASTRPGLGPAVRVAASRELVDHLVAQGKHEEALEALVQLAEVAPVGAELAAEIVRESRAAVDRRRAHAAVAKVASRAAEGAVAIVLLRAAAALAEALGDDDAATAHRAAIAKHDPNDPEALELVEREASERGDHAAVAEILARRVGLAAAPDQRRALRLRRAAVLEQRLARLEDAAKELEAVLAEAPSDLRALRYLADVRERLADKAAAAPLWRKLAELAEGDEDRADAAVRACRGYLVAGDVGAARALLDGPAATAPADVRLDLRLDLARQQGDGKALVAAIEERAAGAQPPEPAIGSLLLEASTVASRAGDDATALERARRATSFAPDDVAALLEARRLEYRARGAGTPREAQAIVDELVRVAPRLATSQVELHAFLLAEELDVIQGGGAGLRELSKRHAEHGPLPLVALGMAERLARSRSFDAALPLFAKALDGDLRGLRGRGHVAIAAADAAVQVSQLEAAARWLEVASRDPEARALAQRRKLELDASSSDTTVARAALEELAKVATGAMRARVLGQLARVVTPTDPERAIALYGEAAALAVDRALHAILVEEQKLVQDSLSKSSGAGAQGEEPGGADAVEKPVEGASAPTAAAKPEPVEAEAAPAKPADEQEPAAPKAEAPRKRPVEDDPVIEVVPLIQVEGLDEPVAPLEAAAKAETPAPAKVEPAKAETPAPAKVEPAQAETPAPAKVEPAKAETPAPAKVEPAQAETPAPAKVEPAQAETPAPAKVEPAKAETPAPAKVEPAKAETPAPAKVEPAKAETPAPAKVEPAKAETSAPAKVEPAKAETPAPAKVEPAKAETPAPAKVGTPEPPRSATPPPMPAVRAPSAPPLAAATQPMPRRTSSVQMAAVRAPVAAPTHAWSLHGEVGTTESTEVSVAPTEAVPTSLRSAKSSWPVKSALPPDVDDAAIASLFDAFHGGSFDAGERLVDLFGDAPERTRDVLAIRRHQASLLPGDRGVLQKLHKAAIAERDAVYAHAIEHVLRAFDPADGPVPPPPLSAQRELPEGFAPVLLRGLSLPICEALGIACETGLFKKDMSFYGLSGLERVQPNAPTLIGETYGRIVRLFGYRTGLFHRRLAGDLEAQIGLVVPPAVILTGEVREETAELKYLLGALLTGALDTFALLNALPEQNVRTLIDAMRAAFGPVGSAPRGNAAVVQLAQDLWQRVPPRAERRLREIFAETEGLDYEQALGASRQAMRRAGLFASGNLSLAVKKTIAELHLALDVPLAAPDGLAKACAKAPAIADLVRFATRAEYADARWQPAHRPEPRRPESTSRFRIPGT
jgi:hypothetical protein